MDRMEYLVKLAQGMATAKTGQILRGGVPQRISRRTKVQNQTIHKLTAYYLFTTFNEPLEMVQQYMGEHVGMRMVAYQILTIARGAGLPLRPEHRTILEKWRRKHHEEQLSDPDEERVVAFHENVLPDPQVNVQAASHMDEHRLRVIGTTSPRLRRASFRRPILSASSKPSTSVAKSPSSNMASSRFADWGGASPTETASSILEQQVPSRAASSGDSPPQVHYSLSVHFSPYTRALNPMLLKNQMASGRKETKERTSRLPKVIKVPARPVAKSLTQALTKRLLALKTVTLPYKRLELLSAGRGRQKKAPPSTKVSIQRPSGSDRNILAVAAARLVEPQRAGKLQKVQRVASVRRRKRSDGKGSRETLRGEVGKPGTRSRCRRPLKMEGVEA